MRVERPEWSTLLHQVAACGVLALLPYVPSIYECG